jgi:arylsulfatase A-like enzyme
MAAERVSRRTLLKSAAAGALGLAAACGGNEKDPGANENPTGAGTAGATSEAAAVLRPSGAIATRAIIIVLDTLRADHVGAYGNDWIKTPTLDALAEESIVFTRAFPESIPTIPMRRTLHTGLRTWPFREWIPENGVGIPFRGWQRIPEEQVTLSETLILQGYHTAFVTDTYHHFKPSQNFHRGFEQYSWVRGQESDAWRSTLNIDQGEVEALIEPGLTEAEASYQGLILAQHLANQGNREKEEDYQAPRVFREAMEWLDAGRKAEEFFLLVDVFDPHEPWDPPDKYLELYADPDYRGPALMHTRYGSSDNLTEVQLQHMRDRYAGEVTMVDHWLGRFLDRARELGMLDDTLVVLTSDHGHQFGEHGLTGKVVRGLWYELVDVPLMIRRPDGIDAGKRVESFAQHHDIAPTVLAALGVAPRAALDGVNLLDLAADRISPREHVSCGFHDYSWCRDARYAYITRNDGTDIQLFDMEADPLQKQNLAANEPAVVETLRQKLLADAGGPLPV